MKLIIVMVTLAAAVCGSPLSLDKQAFKLPEGLSLEEIMEHVLAALENGQEIPAFNREDFLNKWKDVPHPQTPVMFSRQTKGNVITKPHFQLPDVPEDYNRDEIIAQQIAINEKIQAHIEAMKDKIQSIEKPHFVLPEVPEDVDREQIREQIIAHNEAVNEKIQAHIEAMKDKIQSIEKPHFVLPEAPEDVDREQIREQIIAHNEAVNEKIQAHIEAMKDKIQSIDKPHFVLPEAPEDVDKEQIREQIIAHHQAVKDKIQAHVESMKDKVQSIQKPHFELPEVEAPVRATRIGKQDEMPEFDPEVVFNKIKEHHQSILDKINEKLESLQKPDPEIPHYRPAFNDRMEAIPTPYKAPVAHKDKIHNFERPHLTEEQKEAIKEAIQNLPKPSFIPSRPIREGNFEALKPAGV